MFKRIKRLQDHIDFSLQVLQSRRTPYNIGYAHGLIVAYATLVDRAMELPAVECVQEHRMEYDDLDHEYGSILH